GAEEGVVISCGYYLMNLGRRYGSPADIHTQDNGEQRGARDKRPGRLSGGWSFHTLSFGNPPGVRVVIGIRRQVEKKCSSLLGRRSGHDFGQLSHALRNPALQHRHPFRIISGASAFERDPLSDPHGAARGVLVPPVEPGGRPRKSDLDERGATVLNLDQPPFDRGSSARVGHASCSGGERTVERD